MEYFEFLIKKQKKKFLNTPKIIFKYNTEKSVFRPEYDEINGRNLTKKQVKDLFTENPRQSNSFKKNYV